MDSGKGLRMDSLTLPVVGVGVTVVCVGCFVVLKESLGRVRCGMSFKTFGPNKKSAVIVSPRISPIMVARIVSLFIKEIVGVRILVWIEVSGNNPNGRC